MLLLTVALPLFASALAPCTAVQVVAPGIDDADRVAFVAAAKDAMKARGVTLCAADPLVASPECLADARCAKGSVRAAGAASLVALDVARAPSGVRIGAIVIDGDGKQAASADVTRSLADARTRRALPDELLDSLVQLQKTAAGATAARAPDPPPIAATHAASVPTPAPATPEESGSPLLPIAAGVAGAGVLVTAGAVLVGVSELSVIRDASSTGEAKERAAVVVPVAAAAGLVGVGALVGGGVLAWWALEDEAAP